MIALRFRSVKRPSEIYEIDYDSELAVLTACTIIFAFFQLYGMNIYVETVQKDC
jgi:hypothetical protein